MTGRGVIGGLVSAFLLAGGARAGTMTFGSGRTLDWVRMIASTVRPQKDTCLHPNSLIEFDLGDLPPTATVVDARLYFFVEATVPGVALEFSYVNDDSWQYPPNPFQDLYSWPVTYSVGTVACSDTMQIVLDVANAVSGELAAGNGVISFKIETAGGLYPDVRIASPLASRTRMAPRLEVDFVAPLQAPAPDLTVHGRDLGMSPRLPSPGEAVALTASVWNRGPQQADNVSVSFYDGPPPAAELIGASTIATLPGGGGSGNATVNWVCESGSHDIHVVVDELNLIPEMDEQNNVDFRSFEILEASQYWTDVESFEQEVPGYYGADFEVPFSPYPPTPVSFYAARSGAESYHGRFAQEIFLDGTQDDGTVWLERTFPVEPWSKIDVGVAFEFFRYYPDMAFFPVVAIGVLDAEREYDFSSVPGTAVGGWDYLTFDQTVETGPYDTIHLGVGITVTWETPGTFFIDLIDVSLRDAPTGVVPGTGPDLAARSHRSYPNPAGPATTIAYSVTEPGPVRLEIFDARGELLQVLEDAWREPGSYRAHWDGTDRSGNRVASGVYFYRITADGTEQTRKMVFLR